METDKQYIAMHRDRIAVSGGKNRKNKISIQKYRHLQRAMAAIVLVIEIICFCSSNELVPSGRQTDCLFLQ
jgi:hypothetical protein